MKLKYWLWLTQIPYIGVVTANKLMDCMGDPQRMKTHCGKQEY